MLDQAVLEIWSWLFSSLPGKGIYILDHIVMLDQAVLEIWSCLISSLTGKVIVYP